MISQEFAAVLSEYNTSTVKQISSSALNTTFHVHSEGYLHVSIQPQLESAEEALLLDRYIYPNKGQVIAKRALAASSVSSSAHLHHIQVPVVLKSGIIKDPESNHSLAYWLDNEIEGFNAKQGRENLTLEDYKDLINWIIAVQDTVDEEGVSVEDDYSLRNSAIYSLVERGYYDTSIDSRGQTVLLKAVDMLTGINDGLALNQPPVFKHGDLHVANILKTHNDNLAIIDFEASSGGVGDNFKDIMKLLHIDYVFFGVHKTAEGSYLKDDTRMALLNHYVENSKQEGVVRLRDLEYLKKRIALESLSRYTVRLTLAARQGWQATDTRVRRTLLDMETIMQEIEA